MPSLIIFKPFVLAAAGFAFAAAGFVGFAGLAGKNWPLTNAAENRTLTTKNIAFLTN